MTGLIDLQIERPVAGGRMLARHEGQVVLVSGAIPGERARPAVLLVRAQADLGKRPRHVDAELVRRRVLARVETLAAVVAEVGEVIEVGRDKCEALLHRRKDRAKLFAVPARVAHRHHVLAVRDDLLKAEDV